VSFLPQPTQLHLAAEEAFGVNMQATTVAGILAVCRGVLRLDEGNQTNSEQSPQNSHPTIVRCATRRTCVLPKHAVAAEALWKKRSIAAVYMAAGQSRRSNTTTIGTESLLLQISAPQNSSLHFPGTPFLIVDMRRPNISIQILSLSLLHIWEPSAALTSHAQPN
jgi:hypothetical protein